MALMLPPNENKDSGTPCWQLINVNSLARDIAHKVCINFHKCRLLAIGCGFLFIFIGLPNKAG